MNVSNDKVSKRALAQGGASGLRCCNKNQKVPDSKPARDSAGLRDPTSL